MLGSIVFGPTWEDKFKVHGAISTENLEKAAQEALELLSTGNATPEEQKLASKILEARLLRLHNTIKALQ